MSEPYQIPTLPQEQRDLTLGRYMDAWSRMEGFVRLIFRDLLDTDWEVATAVFASMGTKQMKDVLLALGSIRLTPDGAKRLVNLGERLAKLNTKRNNIVHGTWVVNVLMNDAPEGRTSIVTTWVRTYTPVQHELAVFAGRYDMPKIGEKSAFTLSQLHTATKHVEALMGDLSQFFGDIPSLRKPPMPPPQGPN
jgi:hypothetical protein